MTEHASGIARASKRFPEIRDTKDTRDNGGHKYSHKKIQPGTIEILFIR